VAILSGIGNTPLVRLRRLAPENRAEPWGEVRVPRPDPLDEGPDALAMIESAEEDGRISSGDTVVGYTGGSTGPSLALVYTAKGCRPRVTAPEIGTW
jgi:cysteine synthase A